MTPADHGYVKCQRCKCWRPRSETSVFRFATGEVALALRQCTDAATCGAIAGVGKGEIEGAAP